METEQHTSKWRNFAIWSAVGAIFFALVLLGASSLRPEGAFSTIFKSEKFATLMGLGLIVTAVWQGFSKRNSHISLRSFRKFVIWSVGATALFILATSGFRALVLSDALAGLGLSEKIALGVGLALFLYGCFFSFVMALVHKGLPSMNPESVGEVRARAPQFFYSLFAMAARGLTLILLSFAGPGGVLPPAFSLAGVLVLVTVTVVLSLAVRRRMDELAHTLSHETGSLAFYLTVLVGGGWAVLARLSFVAAPAPLDWLTMFAGLEFAAIFIAMARRRLLTR